MRSPSLRGKVVALVLAIALVIPWCAAAAPSSAAPPDLLSRAWQLVASLWSDIGCHLDPNGRCQPPATNNGDTGCHIDPSGGCGS